MSLLTKDSDGLFFDTEECAYESPEMWFFCGILGGCGCGSSEKLSEHLIALLFEVAKPHEERTRDFYANPLDELALHWFDNKNLMEHGTGIGSGWLTPYGQQVYETLVELKEEK